MRIFLSLVALVFLILGVSVALGQPGDREKKPKPEPPSKPEASPTPDEPSTMTQAATAMVATYPPPSTDSGRGVFKVRCTFSHQRQVDPIVNPGPSGTPSGHLHDFLGNRSTDSNSSYSSMVSAGTTCSSIADTAGYWSPSLIGPDGKLVQPRTMFAYYRNKPVKYGTTMSFPKDFRLIAGGVGSFPNAGWSCEQDAANMIESPPDCGSEMLVLHVRFPNCWDGVNIDSGDHRSHVTYADDQRCPSSHPVKVPEIFLHVRYPQGVKARILADGTLAPHADFWNTWQQPALDDLVQRCLRAGVDCGTLSG